MRSRRPSTGCAWSASRVFTVTGRPGVLRDDDLLALRDGALLADVGHFGNEIAVDELETIAVEQRRIAPQVVEYRLPNGKSVRLPEIDRAVAHAALATVTTVEPG